MAVVSVSFISGLSRYNTRYKATTGLTKIESALHYARNLAIANNAVYHVRFENVIVDSREGTLNKPAPEQAIGIYCFPDMGKALSVRHESDATTGWNPFPVKNHRVAGGPQTVQNSGGLVDHDNYLIEKIVLPESVYCGIQYLGVAAQPPYDCVLSFSPDGTLMFTPDGSSRTSATIFITDNLEYADDRTLDPASHAALQENRRIFYNTHTPPTVTNKGKPAGIVRMLQIYVGGLIKVLPAGSSL